LCRPFSFLLVMYSVSPLEFLFCVGPRSFSWFLHGHSAPVSFSFLASISHLIFQSSSQIHYLLRFPRSVMKLLAVSWSRRCTILVSAPSGSENPAQPNLVPLPVASILEFSSFSCRCRLATADFARSSWFSRADSVSASPIRAYAVPKSCLPCQAQTAA
jgi:hypothetical protein